MVYWEFDNEGDSLPPVTSMTPNSFIDTATKPEIYVTCVDSLKSGNFDAIKTNCSIPFFVLGLATVTGAVLYKLLF